MQISMIGLTLTAVLAMAPITHALSYRVELKGSVAEGVAATLHARRIDGTTESVRRDITIPSAGSLPAAEGEWELRIESERVWAASAFARVGDEAPAVLVAMPAGRVRAVVEKRDGSPVDLQLRLTPANVSLRGERVQADVTCPIGEDGEILCTVPAGSWDLRIAPAGFVPQFRWNVAVPVNGTTKIGRVPLVKGAAVIGTVARVGRRLSLPVDTTVRLVPSTVAPQDARALVRQVRPNAKGFFQFEAVTPGEYFISASAKSLTSDFHQIEVVANRTAELVAPLLIDVPRRVKATIAPKLDPEGKPWLVSVSVKRPGSQQLDSYTTAKADAEGAWEQRGLRDGDYLLTVEGSGGGQWASQWFTISGGDLDLSISVPIVQVEGAVLYGDQPVGGARLTFGGEFGSRRQLLTSDENGHFAGVIPQPEGEAWDIYIEADAPDTRLTLHDLRGSRKDDDPILRIDLRLPRTAVFGSVGRPDGTPASFALIRFKGPDGSLDTASAAKDGTFQILGLARGAYEILAEDFLMASDVVPYQISDDENPPLRLTVRDTQQVRGRIVTPGGVPVIGASIGALPVNASKLGMGHLERSNEHGAFLLQVRPDVNIMDILVAPPGFATVIARTAVRADRYMEITVDQLGGELTVDLPTGRDALLSQDGATWSLYLVSWAAGGVDERLENSHRITIPSLRAGQYSVCVEQRCKSGYVPPHGSLHLSLD